jgi:hypothetical protein
MSSALPVSLSLMRMPVTPGLIAEHFLKRAVPADADLAGFFLGEQLVLQNFLAAQLVAAVHQGDVTGNVGQVQRLFDGGIATADDRHRLLAVEEAVTGRASGNAATGVFFFGRQAEILRRSASGDDQCVAGIGSRVTDQRQRLFGQPGSMNMIENDLGVEATRVLLEAQHQLGALHAVRVGRPVVDVGRRRQLPTLRQAGNQHRFEVGAGSVDGCRIAGRAGAEDQQAAVAGCFGHFMGSG